MPHLERLEERNLLVGEVAAFRLVLTDANGTTLPDAATVSVGQTIRLNVNVQDVRPDSEFDALLANIRAHNPSDTRTANDLKGFFQAFLDIDYNANFVRSQALIPESLTFGNAWSPALPATPAGDSVTGTISNVFGKFNDVGNVAANFGDTPLQNGSEMLFFSAPFTVLHAPLNGQPDTANTTQGTSIEIPVLNNDSVGGVVNFLGSPAELSDPIRGQVWMILRGGNDPNTYAQSFPLTSASQLSFVNDSVMITGQKKIKPNSFSNLNGATVVIREANNGPNDNNPTNDVLFYTPAPGFSGQHTFSYQLQNANDPDNSFAQTVNVTVNVAPVNQPPTFNTTTPSTLTIPEDAGLQTLNFTSISAGPGETQAMRFDVTTNNAALIPLANIVRGPIANGAGVVTFQTVQNATGQATITVRVRDAGFDGVFDTADDGLSTVRTFTVNVTPVNDAPILSTTSTPQTYVENADAVRIDPGLALTDVEGDTISTARVSISTSGGVLPEDVLAFSAALLPGGVLPTGVTVGPFAGGAIVISGNSSPANYQSILRAITYRNTSDNPSTLPRTVTFQATDNGTTNGAADPKTGTASRTLNVTPVNDAPVLGPASSAPVVSGFGSPVTIAANLTITDVDSATLNFATVQIGAGFQPNLDQLSFTPQAGLNGVYNPATGVLNFTHPNGGQPASLATYINALRSVEFSSTSGNPGNSRNIVFTINDGGSVNATATLQRTVNIAPANQAPLLQTKLTTIPVYKENAKAGRVIDSKLTLTDADGTTLAGAQVRIVGNFQPGDTLTFSRKAGITGVYDPSTGVLTFTNTNPAAPARLATYLAVLKSVKFSNPGEDNPLPTRTFEFEVNDGGPNNATSTLIRTLNITAVNDAPQITSASLPAVFTTQGAPVVVDAALNVADPDNATLVGATARITGGYKRGQDFLTFAGTANITGTFDPARGTLTFTGNAPLAEYEAVLRSVAYVNTSLSPSTARRTVTFTVNDGGPKGIGTLRRLVNVQKPVQQSLGLSLAVDAAGGTQWFSLGTGWNGFKTASAAITYDGNGVPQSAVLQVVNAANLAFQANLALVGNATVNVSGNQTAGVLLEVFGGSDSVPLTQVTLAEGEFEPVAASEGEAISPLAVRAPKTVRRTANDAAEPAVLEQALIDLLEAPAASPIGGKEGSETESPSADEVAAARKRAEADYAAAVDALLAAAASAG